MMVEGWPRRQLEGDAVPLPPRSGRELADVLGIDPAALRTAAGEPWTTYERSRSEWSEDTGGEDDSSPVFLGPTTAPVALAVQGRFVIVGPAVGQWDGPGSLVWDVGAPSVSITRPSTLAEHPTFLNHLKDAVDKAAAHQERKLVRCQYCGALVPPEHAFNAHTCFRCASRVLGIVF